MASVRGTDPRLGAGSDPDCVTTNQDRDPTYAGTGPDQLPLAIAFAFAFAFALAFALHLSFLWFKGIKLQEKSKIKKNRSPDPTILGRV